MLLRLLLQRDRWRRRTGCRENLVPGRESKVSSYSENRQIILVKVGWLTCFKAISCLWLKDADGDAGRSAKVADGTISTERRQEGL